MSDRIGQVIGGRFRVARQLGEGGMGTVYLARHVELDEFVALKFLKGEVAGDAIALERMRREARAVAKLRGEGVARVLDTGVAEDGAAYLVLEYVSGPTWGDVLREGKMPCDVAVDITLGVAVTLAEAHRSGLVHRDLKPSNVIVSERPDGTPLVKLLDFGIAKHAAPDVRALTETSALLGSPTYMAPEQIRDAKGVDGRADIWSLAVMLYQAVTGELPFRAFTVPALLAKIAADPPTDPRQLNPALPAPLGVALLRALQKDPEERFADIADFADAIAPAASARGAAEALRVRATLRHAPRPEPRVTPEHDGKDSGAPDALRTRTLGATTVTHPTKGHAGMAHTSSPPLPAAPPKLRPKTRHAYWLLAAAATTLMAFGAAAAWSRRTGAVNAAAEAPAEAPLTSTAREVRTAAGPQAPSATSAALVVPSPGVASSGSTPYPSDATREGDAAAAERSLRMPPKARPQVAAGSSAGSRSAGTTSTSSFVDDFGPRK